MELALAQPSHESVHVHQSLAKAYGCKATDHFGFELSIASLAGHLLGIPAMCFGPIMNIDPSVDVAMGRAGLIVFQDRSLHGLGLSIHSQLPMLSKPRL